MVNYETIYGQLWNVNSDQPHRSALKSRKNQELPLNNELCRVDYNWPSTSSILNSQMDTSQTPCTRLQFGAKAEHLMPNLYHEIGKVSGYIDYLVANKHRSDTLSKRHQQQSNAIKSSLLLRNNQAHGYEINDVSKIPFINNEENKLNNEFSIQSSLSDYQMAQKNNGPVEMNRQFSKHGQFAQGMVRKVNLGNTNNNIGFMETEPIQRLNLNNMHAVNITSDTAIYTGSPNTQDTGTSKYIQACFENEHTAVADPSCFQVYERTGPLCDKEFSSKSSTKKHYETYLAEKPFICEICQKWFALKATLKRHKLVHLGEKPFTCKICQKGFARKGNLKTHMLVHLGEKTHKCDICGKCFARKFDLKPHLFIHVDVKPYKCDTCGKAFRRTHHLKSHIRSKHKVTL